MYKPITRNEKIEYNKKKERGWFIVRVVLFVLAVAFFVTHIIIAYNRGLLFK